MNHTKGAICGANAATIVPGMKTSSGNSDPMISWRQPPTIRHHSKAFSPAIAAARTLRQVNPSAVYEIRPVKLYVPADGFGATPSGE